MNTRTTSQRRLYIAVLALSGVLFAATAAARDTGHREPAHRDRGYDGGQHYTSHGRSGGTRGRDDNHGGSDRHRDYDGHGDHDSRRGHDEHRDYDGRHDYNRYPGHYYYGHRISALPSSFVALSVGGLGFYYSSGTFYRPFRHDYLVVPAPVGAVVYSLPPYYRTVYVGPRRYYYANSAWYWWDAPRRAYVVVDPAQAGIPEKQRADVDTTVYAYPSQGQSAEQADRDRYECYKWAVDHTGFDPSRSSGQDESRAADYVRANTACLSGRGYAVK